MLGPAWAPRLLWFKILRGVSSFRTNSPPLSSPLPLTGPRSSPSPAPSAKSFFKLPLPRQDTCRILPSLDRLSIMAPPTRTSARVQKRPKPDYNDEPYLTSEASSSDVDHEAASEAPGSVPPQAKRRRLEPPVSRSPSLSTPEALVAEQSSKPAKDIANQADIWYRIFEFLIVNGDHATVAKCVALTRDIGHVASRILYRYGSLLSPSSAKGANMCCSGAQRTSSPAVSSSVVLGPSSIP